MFDTAEALMEIACNVGDVLDEMLIWRNKFEVLYQGLEYLGCKRPGMAAHVIMSWNDDPEGKCMLLARNGIELHEGQGGRVITLAKADRGQETVLVGQLEDGYWYWEIF